MKNIKQINMEANMRGKRMWQTIRLYSILSPIKRTKYIKEKSIFFSMGSNCLIMDRRVPLYAKLISLGNNVNIASDVHFVTHDIIHRMLNNIPGNRGRDSVFHEKIGCIKIGDNVFIGTGTIILCDVKIGSNVVVGAGSIIVNDIPDNTVVAGVPAKVISSFEKYIEKRTQQDRYEESVKEAINEETALAMWDLFNKKRNA